MPNENLIHIKLEFEEALQSKKDILSSEINLLRIARILKNYHSLRSKELKLKLTLYKKIKEMKSSVRKLEQTLPKIKIPKILEDKDYLEEEIKPKETKKIMHEDNIEEQLKDIQAKLNSLQG